MNLRFWEKEKKGYKRPSYYPTCRIKYTKQIYASNMIEEFVEDSSNFCCNNLKEEFHKIVGFEHGNCYLACEECLGLYTSPNIYYCPFCGAKIEIECIKTLKEVKTGCDEIIEPEKVIPAKTKKVCKYKWVEE